LDGPEDPKRAGRAKGKRKPWDGQRFIVVDYLHL
jgi:hypothetical protein